MSDKELVERLRDGEGVMRACGAHGFAATLAQAVTRIEIMAADAANARRYEWLRDRPWQACHMIFPHAPWIHEGYEINQNRMDAAIDQAIFQEAGSHE